MAWFEQVFGFQEHDYESTRTRFTLELPEGEAGGVWLVSKANGKRFDVGRFECLNSAQLAERLQAVSASSSSDAAAGAGSNAGANSAAEKGSSKAGLTFEHVVGDVRTLHRDPSNAGAVFQVASQFNALEMVGPGVQPEDGITRYAMDPTQGPACALSCPAATLYRNYFCMPGGTGQGGGPQHQLDLLADVGALVGNAKHRYWSMKNGYCMPCDTRSMAKLGERLKADADLAEAVRAALKVAVHWDTAVQGHKHKVCQVFASALPVAYAKSTPSADWAPSACAVLDALYDATLAVGAVLSCERDARTTVYLTAVGGGAFGNRHEWISRAMQRAVQKYSGEPLDVKLVHYGSLPRSGFDVKASKP